MNTSAMRTFTIATALIATTAAEAREPRGGIPTERTAVYLRNHTQLPITLGNFQKYYEKKKPGGFFSGPSKYGTKHDYWGHGVKSVAPGDMRKIWTFDDFQDIVDYRHTKFKLKLTINGRTSGDLLWLYMNVDAGVASYKFAVGGNDWMTRTNQTSISHNGKTFHVYSSKDSQGDIFFTVLDKVGSGGFVPKNAASKDELTVVNYNTFLLIGPPSPFALTNIAVKPKFCERASQMPKYIPEVDVLILNELCSRAYCDIDAKNLPDRIIARGHYKHKSRPHKGGPTVSGAAAPLTNGGLIVLSKYPVENIYEGTFSEGEDGMPKGFLIVKVTKMGQAYYVVGTHTTSGHSNTAARARQFREISQSIDRHVPKGARVVIGGDYNVYDSEINNVKRILNASESGFNNIIPGSYSYTGNYFTDDKSEDKKKFDWILHRDVSPRKMEWRFVPIRSMWNITQPFCDLSDHYAVYAYLDYR